MRARPFIATGLFRVDAAPATFNQYVFAANGTNLYAYTYLDDQYVSALGQAVIANTMPTPVYWSLIAEDSSGTVGDNSLLVADQDLKVWDVTGGVLYEYSPANDFIGGVYHSGKLYWTERTATDFVFKYSDTDLTNVGTLATITHGLVGLVSIEGWGQSAAAYFLEASAGGTRMRYRVVFATGADTSSDVTAEASAMYGAGSPRSDGKVAFFNTDYRLCVLDSDAAAATVTEVWPAFGLSVVTSPSISMNAAGTKSQISNMDVSGSTGAYRDATSGSFGGAPATSFVPEDSPDGIVATGTVAFFYVGD